MLREQRDMATLGGHQAGSVETEAERPVMPPQVVGHGGSQGEARKGSS